MCNFGFEVVFRLSCSYTSKSLGFFIERPWILFYLYSWVSLSGFLFLPLIGSENLWNSTMWVDKSLCSFAFVTNLPSWLCAQPELFLPSSWALPEPSNSELSAFIVSSTRAFHLHHELLTSLFPWSQASSLERCVSITSFARAVSSLCDPKRSPRSISEALAPPVTRNHRVSFFLILLGEELGVRLLVVVMGGGLVSNNSCQWQYLPVK